MRTMEAGQLEALVGLEEASPHYYTVLTNFLVESEIDSTDAALLSEEFSQKSMQSGRALVLRELADNFSNARSKLQALTARR